ncbi:hypothetical protein ACU4GG_06460 [Streptomyces nojiriensis]
MLLGAAQRGEGRVQTTEAGLAGDQGGRVDAPVGEPVEGRAELPRRVGEAHPDGDVLVDADHGTDHVLGHHPADLQDLGPARNAVQQ